MLGMGGIFTELYKDFSTRLVQINIGEAMEMINETKAGEILRGYRNLPQRDVGAVTRVLVRISRLVSDFPMISEIDINPLIVLDIEEGCSAVDVKISLEGRTCEG